MLSHMIQVKLSLDMLSQIDDEEPIEVLFSEDKLEQMLHLASEKKFYVEPYPLADKKIGKRFKLGLGKVMSILIEKLKHEILYDGTFMPWFLEWIMICSQVCMRCLRTRTRRVFSVTERPWTILCAETPSRSETDGSGHCNGNLCPAGQHQRRTAELAACE